MWYFQILDCNNELGSCCSDGVVAGFISIAKKIIDIFQIAIPILLLIMLTVQLTKLLANPDEKNGTKKLFNMIMAAVIVFLLPFLVNLVMNMLPGSEEFQFSACWASARNMDELQKASPTIYIDEGNLRTRLDADSKYYASSSKDTSSTSTTAGRGSTKGQAVVNYAFKFKGKKYVYGGSWNGEIPYVATDCSGFVQGIYKHFGVSLPRTASQQWAAKDKYKLVSVNDIRAGDLAMYSGHVAIFTGNGNEIIHAANPRSGIIVTKDYRYGASNFLGVMRINGVY